MSGGSFGYLFVKDEADIMSNGLSDLEAMTYELEALVPGHPAAVRTKALYEQMAAALGHDRLADIRDVWRAVEWWRSNDWSVEQVREALDAYEAPA